MEHHQLTRGERYLIARAKSTGKGHEPLRSERLSRVDLSLNVSLRGQGLEVVVGLKHQPRRSVAPKVLGQARCRVSGYAPTFLDYLMDARSRNIERHCQGVDTEPKRDEEVFA